jgi:hypothetical protein
VVSTGMPSAVQDEPDSPAQNSKPDSPAQNSKESLEKSHSEHIIKNVILQGLTSLEAPPTTPPPPCAQGAVAAVSCPSSP